MGASVVIPAYRESAAVGDTVRAARRVAGVAEVIVVDDGSRDGTAEAARAAGADEVIALPRNRGKGAALSAGVAAARQETVLLLDADLGGSAAGAGPLLEAVRDGPAMAVGVPSARGGGGFGLALGLARFTIEVLAGLRARAPLSGQRALPRAVVEHIGIAPRFGVEVGLTVEAAHAGVPVREVEMRLEHRRTGRTLWGFRHRGRQFRDILCFLVVTGFGLGWPALPAGAAGRRAAVWAGALAVAFGATLALDGEALPAALAAAAAAAVLWLPCLWVSAVWLGIRRQNYLGRSLPAAAGLVFPLAAGAALWLSPLEGGRLAAVVLVVAVMGAVGLLDDAVAGGRRARGLGGHLRALVGLQVTTGMVKAVGGLGAGLGAGLLLHPGRPGLMVLDALLIALCANFVNLLDLRPGRALKGFAVLSALAVCCSTESLRVVGPLLAAAIVVAPADFAGRAMMGDVGANALGGAAGVALAFHLGAAGVLTAVLALAVVHLVCERVSLTELISGSRALRWADGLGTSHLRPVPAAEGADDAAG
jgi:UDP-N-acetylmuramyl pentapeptide phosphotransferase/UDP-N-acetylglucosamine-1-phosphate transferase